jgi:glutathione synthase
MTRVAFIMDPLERINLKKDSTLAMIRAAAARGWEVTYLQQQDLAHRDAKVWGYGRRLDLNPAFAEALDPATVQGRAWYDLGAEEPSPLGSFDVIFMRKDPPFDMEYIYSTYLLERAQQDGALVVNRPASIRDCNEKYFATAFPECCPPLLVTRRADLIREFQAEHGDIVVKPLDGMGGSSVFRVKRDDPNFSVILETLTRHGQQQIMAQKFLPEISDGDKRILMIDGEPLDYALARIPMAGEARANLAAGGTGEGRPLTDRDRWIAERVGPELKSRGLTFVGIDVIGDYLTEVNVTCPTCIRELDAQFSLDIAATLLETVAMQLSTPG